MNQLRAKYLGQMSFLSKFRRLKRCVKTIVTTYNCNSKNQLECGPMPNVMAALPNIGGALCSTPQSLADAHYQSAVQYNAVYRRNPLKLAGVPRTTGPISAASRPKFTISWGYLEEILLLNKIFPIVDMCLTCKDMA